MKYIIPFFTFVLILFVVKACFGTGLLAGGDLPFLSLSFPKQVFPYVWGLERGNGIGGFYAPFLWTYILYLPIYILLHLKVPWEIVERMVLFFPFLLLSFTSSFFLCRKVVSGYIAYLAPFLYCVNTYILMIVGGGQLWIAMAYAVAPLVVMLFKKLIDNNKLSRSKSLNTILLTGIAFGVQILLDLRIAYITALCIGLYYVLVRIAAFSIKEIAFDLVRVFLLPLCLALLLQSFWLIPVLLHGGNPVVELGSAYSSLTAVKYFSFAPFEMSFSFLHPYWPENIFGKVGFLQPIFLLYPLLAYSAILFLKIKKNKKEEATDTSQTILYFLLLGLLGVFLAKGANEPFGGVYLFLFDFVPGFNLFRDPLKFYLLIAISYSVLIPYVISHISLLMPTLRGKSLYFFPAVGFLLFVGITLRPALTGILTGTLRTTSVPSEYGQLADMLQSDKTFSRTLWVPEFSYYGYYNEFHPAVPASGFFSIYEPEQLMHTLAQSNSRALLQEAGVKYVVVPYDTSGTIFVEDRKYSEKKYQETVQAVEKIPWLRFEQAFGKIRLYSLSGSNGRFVTREHASLSYTAHNPTMYDVSLPSLKTETRLIFTEAYDPFWQVESNGGKVTSEKYHEKWNSFLIQAGEEQTVHVFYIQQQWVPWGLGITLFVFIGSLGMLLLLRLRKS